MTTDRTTADPASIRAGFGQRLDGDWPRRDDHSGRAGGRSRRSGVHPATRHRHRQPRPPEPAASNSTPPPRSAATSVRTDPVRAVAAARTYLAASDVTGTVHLRGGTTVVVTTTAHLRHHVPGHHRPRPDHRDRHRRIPHRPRLPRERTMTAIRRRLLGLLAALALLALVIGLPATLLALGDNPIPEPTPPSGPGDVGVAQPRRRHRRPGGDRRSSRWVAWLVLSAAIVAELGPGPRRDRASSARPEAAAAGRPEPGQCRRLAVRRRPAARPAIRLPADAQPTATHGQVVPAAQRD